MPRDLFHPRRRAFGPVCQACHPLCSHLDLPDPLRAALCRPGLLFVDRVRAPPETDGAEEKENSNQGGQQ